MNALLLAAALTAVTMTKQVQYEGTVPDQWVCELLAYNGSAIDTVTYAWDGSPMPCQFPDPVPATPYQVCIYATGITPAGYVRLLGEACSWKGL